MPLWLLSILPSLGAALVPVIADGFRSVIGWATGAAGAQPQNVDEAIRLMQAQSENLKIIAQLDTPAGNISPWVADLRASFRYITAIIIIAPFPAMLGYVALYPSAQLIDVFNFYSMNLVGPVFSFMFGSRLLLQLKGPK